MRVSPGSVVFAGFILVPLLVLTLSPVTITVSGPRLVVIGLASLSALAALVLFCLALAAAATRKAGRVSQVGQVEREVALIVAAGGALVVTEGLFLAITRWPFAVVYAAVVLAYVALWVAPGMRHIAFRAAVVARCTPDEAFALVSNPRNWPRYFPNIQVFEPIQLPLKAGDLIRDRVSGPLLVVDAVERVLVAEPGRRFGTAVTPNARHSSGVYEFSTVSGGTEIAYVYNATLTLTEALAGVAFERASLVAKLRQQREAGLQRVKQLLEAQPAASV